jgi:hypothetical protein
MPKKIIIPSISFVLLILIGALVLFPIHSSGQMNKLEQDAKKAFDQANFEESIGYYQEILELDPLHVQARLGLAKSYQGIARLDLAEGTLRDAIGLLPAEPLFYTYLSKLFINQSDLLSALSILEQGMKMTNHHDFRDEYETFLSQINIEIERPFIQDGHERAIQLSWADGNGRTLPIEAEWEISNEEVASLQKTGEKLSLKGLTSGTFMITAISKAVTRELQVEVKEQVVEEMEWMMMTDEPLLAVNQEVPLEIRAYDANEQLMSIAPNWSLEHHLGTLSQEEDNKVLFTADREGVETVYAEYDGLTTSLDIHVSESKNVLTTTVTGEGTITAIPQKDGYEMGEVIRLQATPASGWTFVRWTGDLQGTSPTQSITIKSPLTIEAVFERDQTMFSLRITQSGQGNVVQSTLASQIPRGETVTLTARPSQGYEFDRWTGSMPSNNPSITFVINDHVTVQAVFKPKKQVSSPSVPNRETEKAEQPKPKEQEETKKTVQPADDNKPVETPTTPKEPEEEKAEKPKQPEEKPEPVEPPPVPAPDLEEKQPVPNE